MALDFLKTLFGGSEQDQQSTSKPADLTPSEFSGLRGDFAGTLRSLLSTSGPQYTGALYSPETANEQTVRGQLMSSTGPGTDRSQLLGSTLRGDFLPGGAQANPFLDAAIKAAQDPTRRALEETLSRSLPGRFNLAGQTTAPKGSSAFDRAAALATEGAARELGNIATNISYGGYEAERGRQTQAVQLSQAEVDTTVKNLQAQALPRLIQELGIERGMQLFQSRTSALLDILKTLGGVTAPVISQTSQSTGTSESQKGIVPGLLPKGITLPK